MDLELLRPIGLFAGLSDEQLSELVSAAEEVPIVTGTDVFVEGEHADVWWVLVDGALDLVRHIGREDVVVGRMDVPGRWAGGFLAWDAAGVYLATGRGAVPGRLLGVPAAALREFVQRWFPLGAHLVQGLYGTARSIEATARQRDALVTLGTLAAGLAHELNNPAAAASRSVAALEDATRSLGSSLVSLAEGDLTAQQFIGLDRLRTQLQSTSAPTDPIDLSDREDELSDWLADHGMDDGWAMAGVLAAAGASAAWLESAERLLGGRALQPGLQWVADSMTREALFAELTEAIGRISGLVGAVRNYTQMDRSSVQVVDVTEGIESTLLVLGHRLRDESVTVERDYDSQAPHVEAMVGELNQVWTNLLVNAVDAMEGVGTATLRLRTRADGDWVVVDVEDNGAGMPPEVAARAFDPFFTTKEVGKGTGLGLDIARRIVVDRHGGRLDIDSAPGRTVMQVRLPVRRSR